MEIVPSLHPVPPAPPTRVVVTVSLLVWIGVAIMIGFAALMLRVTEQVPAAGYPYVAIAMALVVLVTSLALAAVDHDDLPAWVGAPIVMVAGFAALVLAALPLQHAASLGSLLPTHPLVWPVVVGSATALVLGIVAAAATAPRRSRTPAWLRGTVVFALVLLPVLGLWLPIHAAQVSYGWVPAEERTLAHVAPYLPAALGPPAVLALAMAALAVAWPQRLRIAVGALLVGAVPALAIAVTLRYGIGHADTATPARVFYDLLAPAVIGAGGLALAALAALATSQVARAARLERWRRRVGSRKATVAVEAPASTTTHWLVDHGWLAGYREAGAPWLARLGRDELRMPAAVDVVAPPPPWLHGSTTGTAVPLLSTGAEVELAGLTETAGDGPFRADGGLAVGPGVVVFAPRRHDEPYRRDVVLRMWRPCAVLLLAVAVAALPALVGLP
jgi:hypothetical protein